MDSRTRKVLKQSRRCYRSDPRGRCWSLPHRAGKHASPRTGRSYGVRRSRILTLYRVPTLVLPHGPISVRRTAGQLGLLVGPPPLPRRLKVGKELHEFHPFLFPSSPPPSSLPFLLDILLQSHQSLPPPPGALIRNSNLRAYTLYACVPVSFTQQSCYYY